MTMKNNEDLQKDVQQAIQWEPMLSGTKIGVIAKDGIITLTGFVDTYSKKHVAEDAAKNVSGVRALVEKLEIKFNDSQKKSDNEIAAEVLNTLRWNLSITDQKVKVENGWVTLDGELRWNYQRESAKNAVSSILGVLGVSNNITVKPDTNDEIEKKNIENALARNWAIEEQDVKVDVSGNNVTLTGVVHSLYQREQAERISWNAPGVLNVMNDLIVR
jgi:osmotically-inducible protein OsmY